MSAGGGGTFAGGGGGTPAGAPAAGKTHVRILMRRGRLKNATMNLDKHGWDVPTCSRKEADERMKRIGDEFPCTVHTFYSVQFNHKPFLSYC